MSVTNHLPVGRGKLTETVVAGDAVKVYICNISMHKRNKYKLILLKRFKPQQLIYLIRLHETTATLTCNRCYCWTNYPDDQAGHLVRINRHNTVGFGYCFQYLYINMRFSYGHHCCLTSQQVCFSRYIIVTYN